MTAIYTADRTVDLVDGKKMPYSYHGLFSSSTARIVIGAASVTLLFLSILSRGSNGGASYKIQELSGTVMKLTQQLHTNNIQDELEELKHKLADEEIELEWEKQHIDDLGERKKMTHDALYKEIKRDTEIIAQENRKLASMGRSQVETEHILERERGENESLKKALAFALEELAQARLELPYTSEQKLRGSTQEGFQPGDNIEIIEYQGGGRIALRPGMVDKINPDGTYNLVKLEESTLIPSMKPDSFRKYHVYPPGTQAFYQEVRGVHVPVTIVNYVPDKHLMNPQQPGLELIGGKYQFMFDSDDTQKIAEGNAIRIHRFAEVGDV